MTTYQSNRVASGIPARSGVGLVSQSCEFIVAVALLVNDILQLFTVPKGAVVRELSISSDGTQSGNDSVVTVGDGDDTDRYITGGTVCRTGGGYAQRNAHSGINYQYTAEDTVDMKVTTVGTGQTTGGVIRADIVYDAQK